VILTVQAADLVGNIQNIAENFSFFHKQILTDRKRLIAVCFIDLIIVFLNDPDESNQILNGREADIVINRDQRAFRIVLIEIQLFFQTG
jgi:hypothetical protein